MSFFNFIAEPLGKFLFYIYKYLAFGSYGLSIIYFTIFIRAALLPLTIKQYMSTAKMQEVQPLIQEIQKKYKNDKEKLNQELIKVYQENKVNPAGGCLPILIQMPILISLYYVISRPLQYMMGKSPDIVNKIIEHVPKDLRIPFLNDISIINYFSSQQGAVEMSKVSGMLSKSDLINMDFLGMNLGLMPKWNPSEIMSSHLASQYWFLLLIPILAAATTFLSIKFSMVQASKKSNNDNNNQMQMQNSIQNSMTWMMPLMTLWFSFHVPAGLGLYWIIGNIIQIVQQMYINKYVLKKKEA